MRGNCLVHDPSALICTLANSQTHLCRDDMMKEDDPRRELDDFTFALVEKMRFEVEITMKRLLASSDDMALAQIDILHKRALHRLKNIDFEHDTWLSQMVPGELPEDQVLKVIRIVIAALEQTFDDVREHVIECNKSIYGDPEGGDDETDGTE